ncbi:hypothetical protein TNCV_2347951 [Trichonephila clavipes]|uniref:Uncharacterized protein n=1 Tax=Trichonephila clavipes TaxID=2585209 RepID=A0A8X6SR34_TRICX|nr:hypothetical protein TNCV_2347951 [Trichonephila clavipes]
MLVRLTRAPVLSVGLRRKTQLFSGTLYMAASSKTPPCQSKGSGGSKGESKEVKIAREKRVRETRNHKRVSSCQKITKVPRDCDTRTHLKKSHSFSSLLNYLRAFGDGPVDPQVVKVSNHGWHASNSSPVPQKTRRVEQGCTLNLSKAEMSSRWCAVVVRRGGASSSVTLVI